MIRFAGYLSRAMTSSSEWESWQVRQYDIQHQTVFLSRGKCSAGLLTSVSWSSWLTTVSAHPRCICSWSGSPGYKLVNHGAGLDEAHSPCWQDLTHNRSTVFHQKTCHARSACPAFRPIDRAGRMSVVASQVSDGIINQLELLVLRPHTTNCRTRSEIFPGRECRYASDGEGELSRVFRA